jgi:hypothetical protein
MTKRLILTIVLAAMLACSGTIQAVVSVLGPGRRNLDVESDKDRQDSEDDCNGVSDESMQEFVIKNKPKPVPLVPPPAPPKPKPQPKPRATPPPTPKPPTPTPPVTQPS